MIARYQTIFHAQVTLPFWKVLLFLTLLTSPIIGFGQSISDSEARDLLTAKVRSVRVFALHPLVVQAVRAQNAENLSLETIQERDAEWTQSDDLTALKRSMTQSPLGRYLRERVEGNSAFNEAFATDNQGANVAAYPLTSDYWQGDEEKWTAAFNEGDGQIFIGPLETDESTGVVASQISAPVIDKGETIGVLVVGITVNYLEAKQAQ